MAHSGYQADLVLGRKPPTAWAACRERDWALGRAGNGARVIVSRHSRDVILLRLAAESLAGQNLHSTYLVAADLRGRDCRHTTFRGATLRRADLREANLQGADLSGADLSGADLRQADFTGADVTGATFDGALWDERTRWPSGFQPAPAPCRPPSG